MHTDLAEKIIARRLRALADEWNETPYGWAEFQRRRDARSITTRLIGRNLPAAAAIAVAVAAVVVGLAIASLSHLRTSAPAPADTAARVNVGDRADVGGRTVAGDPTGATPGHTTTGPLAQQRTRELEGWLADLPRDPAVVRVGAHAAVTSLQDQIAALDDLMSAERVAGAQPSRLDALERQRTQLVSSLAQVQYAEMLASATP